MADKPKDHDSLVKKVNALETLVVRYHQRLSLFGIDAVPRETNTLF